VEWQTCELLCGAAFEQYADDIFGNTPEMISFFSETFNYPFPWEKYSQVVVRDFVSGAMENTQLLFLWKICM
jgi:aminopeptidase N